MKTQTETMMRNKIFEFLEILGETYERGLPLSGRVNNKPRSKIGEDLFLLRQISKISREINDEVLAQLQLEKNQKVE